MVKLKVSGSAYRKVVISILVIGNEVYGMDLDNTPGRMVALIMASSKMESFSI